MSTRTHRRQRRDDSLDLGATGPLRLLPFIALLAGALVAPWLRGGRMPDAFWMLGAIAWLGVAAALVVVIHGRGYDMSLARWRRGLLWSLPAFALVALLLLSAINPLYEVVAGSQPRVLELTDYRESWPLIALAERSRPAIFCLSGYLLLATLVLNRELALPARWLRLALLLLLINATLLCAIGIFFKITGSTLMLGSLPVKAHYFFATFYYKNHWAAYALLYLAIAIGFFFRDLPRWVEDTRRAGGGAIALIAALFIGISLPLSESRSGTLLLALAALLLIIGIFRLLPQARIRWVAGGLALLFIGGTLYLAQVDLQEGWDRTQRQIDQSGTVVFDGIRAQHGPEVCLRMLRERPLLGWGFYSFDPLFPAFATDFFRHPDGRMRYRMEFAHSDWMQFTAELGLLGMGLLLIAVAGALVRGRFGGPCTLSRWALIGIGLLLILAIWEFPFSNPAVLTNAIAVFVFALAKQKL